MLPLTCSLFWPFTVEVEGFALATPGKIGSAGTTSFFRAGRVSPGALDGAIGFQGGQGQRQLGAATVHSWIESRPLTETDVKQCQAVQAVADTAAKACRLHKHGE